MKILMVNYSKASLLNIFFFFFNYPLVCQHDVCHLRLILDMCHRWLVAVLHLNFTQQQGVCVLIFPLGRAASQQFVCVCVCVCVWEGGGGN